LNKLIIIIIGALRIYRAPGSVAFLNCANALKPILPKSQAWCVDGDSKFVLQIRPPQYWRIEVPNKTVEEGLKVEELKRVLEEVLRFEKTPCPFQRNFTVELPKAPETPVKKKPWRPVERPKDDTAIRPSDGFRTPSRSLSCSPGWGPRTSKSRSPSPLCALDEDTASIISETESQSLDQDRDIPGIELGTDFGLKQSGRASEEVSKEVATLEPSLLESPVGESVFEDFTGTPDDSDAFSNATEDIDLTPRSHVNHKLLPLNLEPEKDDRPQALQSCSRSITAPPVLSLVTSPPSSHRTRSTSPLESSNSIELDSAFSSSVESFHSVQSWHSPLEPPSPYASGPPSPSSKYPYPHEGIVLPKRPDHTHEVSEIGVAPETPRPWGRVAAIPEVPSTPRAISPPPQTPTLSHDGSEKSDEEQFEVLTPPTVVAVIRHRATTSSNSRRRALSPLPPAVNLFSPPRRNSRRLRTARHLPTAIIQKTCEILLSPPSHLFHLMISIATKITAGEWRGVLSGHGWDFEDEYGGDGLFEDDYGISLPSAPTGPKPTTSTTGGSWEVD
jgi:hypothetical protein